MSEVASKESIEAAKGYESLLVPSLFQQWTDWVLDATATNRMPGLGTGILRHQQIRHRVGPPWAGRVEHWKWGMGLDTKPLNRKELP